MDDKTPFLAGVQQELFFLPTAARFLAGSRATRRGVLDMLEVAIRKEALSDGHLEGLGVLRAPREDREGNPARPDRATTVRAMAEDCLEQMEHLELFDENGRITPEQLALIENRAWLRRAVLDKYGVQGRDGKKRSVVSHLYNTFEELDNQPRERVDEPLSARFRRGLCLAEFMRLHFWMADLDKPHEYWAFAEEVMPVRENAMVGLDVGEGGIEYAALVMADAAAEWLLEHHKEDEPRSKIPAARSTVLMLCDAGVLVPQGFPGGLQWLYPAPDLKKQRPRREKRRRRRTGK